MLSVSMPRAPRYKSFLILLIALADCFLILAYWPSLADTLELALFVQPSPPPPSSPRPTRPPDSLGDMAGICQPATVSAEKAPLDDDTPVIGVLAAGHARAYLLEAFEHGPASHLVNDVLGSIPISVSHCDISGYTRVFTSATAGRPLELVVGGRKDSRMLLKCDGHLFRQETTEPLDKNGSTFPYREYPADLTAWGKWRQAHPDTDVYMGTIDESTPTEAGGPRMLSPLKPFSPVHHAS